MKRLALIIMLVLNGAGAMGQTTLLGWEVTGQINYGEQGLAASAVATGVMNSTGLTRGSGVKTGTGGAADAWGGYGWNYPTSAEALAANVYVTFGLTVESSFSTSLSGINLTYRRSSTGPSNGSWAYRLNGGAWSDLGDFPGEFSSTSTTGSSITPISLSGKSDLQNLPAGSIVDFRIIPYGASGSTGTWYVYNGSVAGSDLTVTGTLADHSLRVEMLGASTSVEAGKVRIDFSTATELDLAGFNIYRSTVEEGPFGLIASYISNPALRAAGTTAYGGTYSFIDDRVSAGTTYYYKLDAVEKSGKVEQAGGILSVTVSAPKEFALCQNYPNPFNPTTAVGYQLPAVCQVELKVYDVLGREIVTLVKGQQNPGTYSVMFDAGRLPSGVYFYSLFAREEVHSGGAGSYAETKKMLLMK